MTNTWMLRAGENAIFIDEFLARTVSVGWQEVGDLTNLKTQEEIHKACKIAFPNYTKGQMSASVAMLYKFRTVIKIGDSIVTYDPGQRIYSVGTVQSDYFFRDVLEPQHTHLRSVHWEGAVSRDKLSINVRNSLGSVLTLFTVNKDNWAEINELLSTKNPPLDSIDANTSDRRNDLKEGFVLSRKELRERTHELIKDKIVSLSPDDLEELTAALLRAMGFKARVSPKGPDRGIDVFASPDGLGLEEPRIKVEVKHRQNTSIGSQDLRSFIGVLRPGDKGLYVSTGGFTKEAKYEAERSNHPITLLDLDELAVLIVDNYENFDVEGQTLMPLTKVYVPNE